MANRKEGIKSKSFNFIGQNLTFEKPDFEKFKCLKLAYQAGNIGGSMPCVLNSANEFAVEKFLKDEISFSEIEKITQCAIEEHNLIKNPSLEELFEVDREVRSKLNKKYLG